MNYKVNEIFQSIQGEGSWMGRPVVFLRLSVCNLSCPWCDTDFDKYEELPLEEVVRRIKRYGLHSVVITGGEPTLHDLYPLIASLQACGMRVAIETNGTQPTPTNADWIVCSPKPEVKYQVDERCFPSELKYIVTPDFTLDCISPKLLERFKGRIWLHPEASEMQENVKRILELMEKSEHPEYFRIGLQMHKIIGVN